MLENTASQRSAFLAEIISPLVFSQENLYNSLGAFCFLLFDRIPGSCSLLMTVLYGQAIHSLKHEIHTKETTLIELEQEVSTLHVQLDSKVQEVDMLTERLRRASDEVSSLRQALDAKEQELSSLRVHLDIGHGQVEAGQHTLDRRRVTRGKPAAGGIGPAYP